ncbi:MAG: hypothetical protein MI757_04705, partial [Pirellulales bacterium]|nr:hypothetical protein [Pirellulales bacterium]
MDTLDHTTRLVSAVAARQTIARFAKRWFWLFLIVAAVYLAALVVIRLTGFLPGLSFAPWSVAIVIILPTMILLVFRPKPDRVDAARAIDERRKSKDLFLTAALMDRAAGEFQPLVAEQVEKEAARTQPAQVVPFSWSQRAFTAIAVIALLACGSFWIPQLDPFGRVADAQEEQTLKTELANQKRAAALRVAALREDKPEEELSPNVSKELEKLKLALQKMKPKERDQNRKKLAQRQKSLGQKWRGTSAEALKQQASSNRSGQSFGGQQKETLRRWQRELEQGSTESISQQISEAKDRLRRLQKEAEPEEREKLAKQLKNTLQDLEDFARNQTGSKPLAAALEQALNQLDASGIEGLSADALEGLQQSLDLSQLELEQLAQSARDLKKLEQALKLVQQAKKLNSQDLLDGESAAQCKTLEDYEKMFQEMLAQTEGEGEGLAQLGEGAAGKGDGAGLGGEGIGRGGKAEEDDSEETQFRTEQATSAITAGKILLSLKSKGVGESGAIKKQH